MTWAKQAQRRKVGMTARIEWLEGRKSHARGVCGGMGQGEGWG